MPTINIAQAVGGLATASPVKPLALVATKTEPRVDSRLLAQQLGNKHKSVMAHLTTTPALGAAP